jgi:NAD(P)-dependent dehydrogenase (short-subunit alcohol dehydrogenase family)
MRPRGLKPLTELISFHGRRALVTGAAAGIGSAVAYRLAEAGAALELVDVDGDKLKTVAAGLKDIGIEIHLHETDVSSREEIDRLWSSLEGRSIDLLINNAGIYPSRPFLKIDQAFYDKVMSSNMDSVFWMCQAMIRERWKQGGTIINIASIEAILPFKDDLVAYSMSKAGVIALTRSLAKEYGRHDFRINTLLPGGIVTPGTKKVAQEVFHFNFDLIKTGVEFKQRLPIGRIGQADEVARMVLVLASDLASYVHGAVIAVDGGFLSA